MLDDGLRFDPLMLEIGADRDFLSAADRAWLARTDDDDVYYFTLPGVGPGKWPVRGSRLDLVLEIPYFVRPGMAVPPMSALAEVLAADCHDAGMSGGIRFAPLELTAMLYQQLRNALVKRGMLEIEAPPHAQGRADYLKWARQLARDAQSPAHRLVFNDDDTAEAPSVYTLLEEGRTREAYRLARRSSRRTGVPAIEVDSQWWGRQFVLARAGLASLCERTDAPQVLLATAICDEHLGRMRSARIFYRRAIERSPDMAVRMFLARLLCLPEGARGSMPFKGWRKAALVRFLRARLPGEATLPVVRDDQDRLARENFASTISVEEYLSIEAAAEFDAAVLQYISLSLQGRTVEAHESLERVVALLPDDAGLAHDLGPLLLATGYPHLALEVMEKAVRLHVECVECAGVHAECRETVDSDRM